MPILGIIASQISGRLYDGPFGAYDSLAAVTVPSGGLASITFSGIPTGYKHLQIRGFSRSTDAGTNDVSGILRFNSDSGANYSWHRMYGYGSGGMGADSSTNTSSIVFSSILANGNTANCFSVVMSDILDYANTSKFKTTRSLAGGDANNLGMVFMNSGNWRSLNAVSSITLTASSGNFVQNSQFALYGVK